MATLLTALVFSLAAMPVSAGDAPAMARTRAELRAATAALRLQPTLAHERRVRGAMRRLDALLDSCYHAPNLREPKARAHALALRAEVHLTTAGPNAVMVLRDDVFHFRPEIHRALADAAGRRGAHADAVAHLRAALAVAARDVDSLAALKEAYLALGQTGRAQTVAQRIELLERPRP